MSLTKQIGNYIYRALNPHQELLNKAQALIMWHDPLTSGIMLGIVELCFVFIYFLPFTRVSNTCIIIGTFLVLKELLVLFKPRSSSIKEKELNVDAPNRIRTVQEISAFLTTVLSLWVNILEIVFRSIRESSVIYATFSMGCLFITFLACYVLGDFMTLWTIFHAIFILPGLLLQPRVLKYISGEESDTPSGSDAHVEKINE